MPWYCLVTLSSGSAYVWLGLTAIIGYFHFLSNKFSQFFTDLGLQELFLSGSSMTLWSPKLRSLTSKGKKLFTSECWTFRGHYLKTSPLRFFSSENKKRRKIRLVLETILQNCYILIFDPLLLKKLIFFLRPYRILVISVKWGLKSKNFQG